MWLVLCDSNDDVAIWAAEELKSRGLSPLEVVTTEDLVWARRWQHYVGNQKIETRIELNDGRVIDSSTVRGTLNRLTTLPSRFLQTFVDEDQEYVAQEIYALILSWLFSLRGITINPPHPLGLAGPVRSQYAWNLLAAQVGLAVSAKVQSQSSERLLRVQKISFVVVANGKVFGNKILESVEKACCLLASKSNIPLLGITLQSTQNSFSFSAATSLPDLRVDGVALLDFLTSEFVGKG